MHVRRAVRDAVRTALAAAMTDISWPREYWLPATVSQLPVGGVATPRDSVERIDVGAVNRTSDLAVTIRRAGTETIEDDLDADAVQVESAVMGVLPDHSDDYDLSQITTTIDASGKVPVAELLVLFRVVLRTPEGTPD